MSTDHALFVSVKPRFAEKILAGEKSVELRRVRPSVTPGTLVIFYASSPTREVVGTGRADLRERLAGFEPPQSFRYVNAAQAATLI